MRALVVIASAMALARAQQPPNWHWNAGPLMGQPRPATDVSDDRFNLPSKEEAVEKATRDGDGDDKTALEQSIIESQYLESSSRSCREEPPFLYVTLHDYNNLLKSKMLKRDGSVSESADLAVVDYSHLADPEAMAGIKTTSMPLPLMHVTTLAA